MKLFSLFSRPAWENADANKRAHAVANLQDAVLAEKLPEIARHDADAKVRLAAVRRIDDLSLLGDRARLDLAPEVRDAAGQRLRQRLLDVSVAVDARIRIVRVIDNEPLLELVATEAAEVDLRACALERIRRMTFLVDRCTRETDAKLRLILLDRIEDPVHLERISERARKTDKQLSRIARERLQTARLAAGDSTAVEARATELCAALDVLMRQRTQHAASRVQEIDQQWQQLNIAADQPISRRYRGLFDTLQHMLNPPPKPEPVVVEAVAHDVAVSEIALETAIAVVATVEPEVDAATLAERANAEAANEASRIAEQTRRREWRERVHAAVKQYAQTLDAGKFADARAARAALQAIEGESPKSQWDEAKQIAELELQYAKLERWQQWSAREAQKRLCESAEALIGSGLHPDALLTRVRERQGEWERASTHDPASANDGIGRRFRAIIAQSIAPARPYLEKRKELRDEKSRALVELLDTSDAALADESLSLASLLEWRSKLGDAGAQVAEMVGNDRRSLGERRKQLMDAVHARVEAFNNNASEGKQQLLARLRRQLAAADLREQVNIAKAAMPQWKSLPRGQRKTEDALWAEFRALIDPVFEREREQTTQSRNERDAQNSAVAEALAEFEALANADLDTDAIRAQSQQLRQRFQELPGREREHDLAFERAHAKLTQRVDAARIAQVLAARDRTQSLSANVAAIEQRVVDGMASGDWAAVVTDAQLDTAPTELVRRLTAAKAASTDPNLAGELRAALADYSATEAMAIRLELLANLPSPDAFREQRRELQMARLAAKLSGGQVRAMADETRMLWREWLDLAGTGAPARTSLDARIAAAFAVLFDAK